METRGWGGRIVDPSSPATGVAFDPGRGFQNPSGTAVKAEHHNGVNDVRKHSLFIRHCNPLATDRLQD